MTRTEFKNEIEKLANKLNLQPEEVEIAYFTQFRYLAYLISSDMPAILKLPKFGKFYNKNIIYARGRRHNLKNQNWSQQSN